jgi:hypothetical protein
MLLLLQMQQQSELLQLRLNCCTLQQLRQSLELHLRQLLQLQLHQLHQLLCVPHSLQQLLLCFSLSSNCSIAPINLIAPSAPIAGA